MSVSVSVIIPVYNKSEYIERCAESLAKQNFSDFEVLFVDDGSTDSSAAICERIAEDDRRFHLIRQENAGVSAARNNGIRAASGKYLAFADPDDTVGEDFLSALFYEAQEQRAQITCGGYTVIWQDGHREEFVPEQEEKRDVILNLIKEHPIYNAMWNKLYLREFVTENRLFVPEKIIIGEDALFNLSAYTAAVRISFVKKPVYNYFIYEDSAMNTENNKENRLVFLEKRCEAARKLDLMNECCAILAGQIYESGGNVGKILGKVKIDNKLLQAEINTGLYPAVKKIEHVLFRLRRKYRKLTGREY